MNKPILLHTIIQAKYAMSWVQYFVFIKNISFEQQGHYILFWLHYSSTCLQSVKAHSWTEYGFK